MSNKERDEKIWRKEFHAFVSEEPVAPPAEISRRILDQVRGELRPPLTLVFVKLGLAHLVAALAVVATCPQLGVGPLFGGMGLMGVFMRFGSVACTVLCGAFFLSVSQLLATLVLSREELRRAKPYEPLSLTLLATASLAALMLAGGQTNATELLLWAAGGIVGGFLTFHLGLMLRLRLL